VVEFTIYGSRLARLPSSKPEQIRFHESKEKEVNILKLRAGIGKVEINWGCQY
jgi:hypothetical protein